MKREVWKNVYGAVPEALNERVSSALSQLEKEEIVMKRYIMRTVALAMGLMLLIIGTVWAVSEFGILSYLSEHGDFLTQEQQERLQTEFAVQSAELGNVRAEIREMISDGVVGMVMLEFTAPEGMYLYTDSVNMTAEEWEMDRAARFAKYGQYEELGDVGIDFVTGDHEVHGPESEYMLDGERLAENKIRMVAAFPVGKYSIDMLQVSVSTLPVIGENETAERLRAVLKPEYKIALSPVKKIEREFDAAATPWGLTKATIGFSELATQITADYTGAIDRIEAFGANGEALPDSVMGGMIGASSENSKTIGCGTFDEIPDLIYLQAQVWSDEVGDLIPVGEPVEVNLK